MKNQFLWIVFVFFTLLSNAQNVEYTRKLPTAFGPEDLVYDNYDGRDRLLISASSRWLEKKEQGAILTMNPHTGYDEVLPIKNENKPFFFSPHGIDLVKENDGKVYLYVISHEPVDSSLRHKVIKMEVFDDYLNVVEIFEDEHFISPNDITAKPDGSFYLTNDSKRDHMNLGMALEKIFRVRTSKITYKSPDDKYSFVAKNLAYANGICNRNDTLWVSTTQKKNLIAYQVLADGSLEKLGNLTKIKGLDNLCLQGNWLYTAAHPSFGKFLKHAKPDRLSISPCDIYRVNIKTGEQELLFSNDGGIISAASTALPIGEKVIVGQVFADFLLELIVK